MLPDLAPDFLESADDLRCLVRLTVEFDYYLRHTNTDLRNTFEMEYRIASIRSGMDSFVSFSDAYRVMVVAIPSQINWTAVTVSSLKGRFLEMFDQFVAEPQFERRFRLLLDLFKLQIVFAGMFYD